MGVSKSRATLTAMLGGSVLGYGERTSVLSITATTEGTAQEFATTEAIAFDGLTTILVDAFIPGLTATLSGGENASVWLYDNGSSIGRIAPPAISEGGSNQNFSQRGGRKLTPSAGSHTYSLRASVSSGTGQLAAGVGGAGNNPPAFIRITRESTVIGGTGIAGVQGGFAPLDSGLLIPAAYLPPPLAGYAYRRTAGDYSTSSTSFVDVDATNLKPTLTVQANHRIKVTLQARNSGVAATGSYFQVIIDGTAYRLWYGELQPDGDNCWVVVSPQLAAGARLVNVQYATDSGTFTLSGDADHPLQFVAEELSY